MGAISWSKTPMVAKIEVPNGTSTPTVYYIKDEEVRDWIGTGASTENPPKAEKRISDLEAFVQTLSNATRWVGVTTTAIYDGDTTHSTITIGGQSHTAETGDIASYNNAEFIYNGSAWQELGTSVGTLKAFAYADQGEVTVTPSGSNSSSSVTFAQHTTATVLTSSVTGTVPKLVVTPTTKYLTASASGTAVSTSKMVKTNVFSSASVSNETLSFGTSSVATGALAANGGGDSVATGISTQPSITLTEDSSSSTGSITYVKSVSSSNSGTNSVTFDTSTSGKTAAAITALGAATATAQTFTGTAATYDVDPKSST